MADTPLKRRKLRNYLIDPKYQLKVSAHFLVATIVIFGGLLALIFIKINAVRELILMEPEISFSIQQAVHSTLITVTWLSLIFFAVAATVVLIYAILVSHRVAGPIVAIQAYIEDLKKGNYDSGRKLRPNDELNPVMESLHDLADHLKKSKS